MSLYCLTEVKSNTFSGSSILGGAQHPGGRRVAAALLMLQFSHLNLNVVAPAHAQPPQPSQALQPCCGRPCMHTPLLACVPSGGVQ